MARLVITAGPTREFVDPVRFLSNPSTGKMGFAIAAEAARRGHEVTLVAGPVALKTPKGVARVDVVSAREMLAAAVTALTAAVRPAGAGREPAVFISTAAVADWRPASCAKVKLKKREMPPTLRLARNPDILKTVRARFPDRASLVLVGFAAETGDVLSEAARKCREKGLSLVVANDVTAKGCGFGTDTNRVTLVAADGTREELPLMTKRRVAAALLGRLFGIISSRES